MGSLLSLLRTISARYLQQRWDRAVLIVISIGLGVAMLVSTQLLSACLDAAAGEAASPGSDNADLVVTSNRRVKLELLPIVRAVPEVASAQPLIVERVILPDYGNRTAVLVGMEVDPHGIDRTNALDARTEIINPLAWQTGRGAMIARDLARVIAPDGKPLQAFRIRAGGQVREILPIGTVELSGRAAKLGGFLLAMEINQAARLLDQAGLCERIDIRLSPGAQKETALAAIQAAIGDKARVQTPESAGRPTQEVIGGIRIGFTLCGVGALVVGLFLVYNALAVSVAERRHDIGVLRSTGATRWQIAGLFTVESILLGLVGSILGAPLGLALARFTFGMVRTEMQQVFLTANQQIALDMNTLLLAIGSGTLTAWLAALVPALQAASDEPADAVRRTPTTSARFLRVLQGVASLGMILGGFSFVLIREYLPHRVGGYGGMVLLLVGLLLAVPLLVGLLARVMQPVTRRVFSVEARLAADNLLRAPGRTGVVVGALAAGVTLMFQTAGIGRSNEEPILDWLDRAVSADFFVICGDINASSTMLPMKPEVATHIKDIPGVAEAMTIRYGQLEFRERLIFLTALDARIYHDSNRKAHQLPKLALFQKLAEPNTCLVSENFSALYKVATGDTIELRGGRGLVPMRIVGVVEEYSWSRGTVVVDRSFYADAFADPLIDGVHVFLNPEPDRAAAHQRVKDFTDSQALVIVTQKEFQETVVGLIRRMYLLAYVQQAAIGLVAALGVVTALLISVLQRRRELGLLRAVGATRAQVLRTVLAEAALMGIIGTLLGVLAGIPLEWYLLRVVIFEESGFLFPVTMPWKETLILSAVSIGAATVAGIFPALHAVRLRIAESIAYE